MRSARWWKEGMPSINHSRLPVEMGFRDSSPAVLLEYTLGRKLRKFSTFSVVMFKEVRTCTSMF